jgi:hypothetical protein
VRSRARCQLVQIEGGGPRRSRRGTPRASRASGAHRCQPLPLQPRHRRGLRCRRRLHHGLRHPARAKSPHLRDNDSRLSLRRGAERMALESMATCAGCAGEPSRATCKLGTIDRQTALGAARCAENGAERDSRRERELTPGARIALHRSDTPGLLVRLGWTSFYVAPDASCSWPIRSDWVTVEGEGHFAPASMSTTAHAGAIKVSGLQPSGCESVLSLDRFDINLQPRGIMQSPLPLLESSSEDRFGFAASLQSPSSLGDLPAQRFERRHAAGRAAGLW